VQRDLYSAFLASYLDPAEPIPSCAQFVEPWEGAGAGGEARLKAAHERVIQRANEGQVLPRSMGIPRVGARLTDQSERSDTRAAFPLQEREGRSVEAPPRTPRAWAGGVFSLTGEKLQHVLAASLINPKKLYVQSSQGKVP